MGEPLRLADLRFKVRPVIKDDIPAITDVFFHSFNARFWQYFIPDKPAFRRWWNEAWALGVDNPTDRTFVVEDTAQANRIVAFSRWMVPQPDGNQERKWPEMEECEWDMEVAGAFFGGMESNRLEMMGKRPHWCT